jgi:hypothetical protein
MLAISRILQFNLTHSYEAGYKSVSNTFKKKQDKENG